MHASNDLLLLRLLLDYDDLGLLHLRNLLHSLIVHLRGLSLHAWLHELLLLGCLLLHIDLLVLWHLVLGLHVLLLLKHRLLHLILIDGLSNSTFCVRILFLNFFRTKDLR